VIVLAALLITVLLGMVSFAIDCGMISLTRTELQSAADAGAMAGAAVLSHGPCETEDAAQCASQANRAAGRQVSVITAEDVQLGTWDKTTLTFTPLSGNDQSNANAVKVTCVVSNTRKNALSFFFAPIFGQYSAELRASAVATAAAFNCGPFIGLDGVTISGGSYTDSYNSDNGAYYRSSAGKNGHVCSNSKISLSGGSTVVNGDAHPGPTSSVSASGGSYVTGSKTPLDNPLNEPPVDASKAKTDNDNEYVPNSTGNKDPLDSSGNYKLSGGDTAELPPGTYYFSSLTLSGGSSIMITGKTVIYVSGNVDISGGSLVNTTQKAINCQLYSTGSKVTLSGGSQWYGVVYAPTADIVRSSGSADFYGMAVGKTLTLSGGGGCHYDEALDYLTGHTTGAQLVQ
jgi:Flp pilus assembly protein TadG